MSWLFVNSNRDMLLDAAVANNRQIVKNIDTALHPLLSLSMYPYQDKQIYQIMEKDYSTYKYPLLERQRDFNTVNSKIENNFFLFSTIIDSVLIYQGKNNLIVGRSNLEYMDHAYFRDDFYLEPYIQEILKSGGTYVPVGVHQEKLFSYKDKPVVSIGRGIVNPYTQDQLGFILINISIEKLKTLWSDIHFTKHTKFYLVDDKKKIIYSKNKKEIGTKAATILGENFNYIDGFRKETKENKDSYLITATSNTSKWKSVTIIPKKELFDYLSTFLKIIIITSVVFLLLAVLMSFYIATSITKPLSILEGKMRQVSDGNMNVKMDIEHGEIGKISKTIDIMLSDIRRLIERIYNEEEEKRKLELMALQSQIRPHFMYNTINVIKWMAKIQGASGIEEALSAFSSVIRLTAKTVNEQVTIKEEVEFIKNYTKILEFRYFNKFEVSFEIEPSVLEYKTIKFLLQPLVENAVFHAFDDIDYKGKIAIQIFEDSQDLVMKVSDNGRGIADTNYDSEQSNKEGSDQLNSIGISNIRKRIQLNFGDNYGLWITSQEAGGTLAKLIIPVIK
ncbi:sensor histidine kinase [Bacillus sp. OV166]|uniref:sensor histidine kinase n=1 Tax=Bacillus sp. OV166 TaxID=1882763 RepID=UPI00211AF697|nr:sensor histidine kinase [Bacillus sp. OV166]